MAPPPKTPPPQVEIENDEPSSSIFNLPVASLKLDPATQLMIDTSQVKKLMGPLVSRAHAMRAHRLALLSWDSDAATYQAAQVLTAGLSQQVDHRCALIVTEGIRFGCDNFDCFSRITLPEIEPPHPQDFARIVEELNRSFPFQIVVGPSIKDWKRVSAVRAQTALSADAQILILPSGGVPRDVSRKIQEFTEQRHPRWLGAVSVDPRPVRSGGSHV